MGQEGNDVPRNDTRAKRIDAAMLAYRSKVGDATGSPEEEAIDLMTDFFHWIEREGLDRGAVYRAALNFFMFEVEHER